ncbi:MAG: FimB/Mfa2 family fimbrial subunit [Tannerellaceae bacterium]|nr:FimB/Mfa2 family fimbrial subunit [Tannerellaceae bacterium]
MNQKPSDINYTIRKRMIVLCLPVLLAIGCNKEDQGRNRHEGDSFISLSVRAASRSINQDEVYWEDRVDELRMLVFNPDNGEVVFNEKLYFPNGFEVQSKAVLLPVGTYNFYFIANETVYQGDFTDALLEIENESEFGTDTRFASLAYHPDFTPDGTSTEGRFLMSAVYTNIAVTEGGTETNPTLLAVPNGRVELIRSLAKVEVVFRKKVLGSTVPENTITSVLLENVATTFSVPPIDEYYTGNSVSSNTGSLAGLDYTRDSIGAVSFYIPEFLIPEGSTISTLLEINNQTFPIENDAAFSGLTSQRRTVPPLSTNSVIRNYHYIINAYIDGEGGIVIEVYVKPWQKDTYTYLFQGDQQIVIPPIYPTDSSIIFPTECGRVEILSVNEYLTQGLQGAYNDTVVYYDPVLQGPTIKRGNPPYYCEKKYGEGWRLINSCELLSFLAICDVAYNVWTSNTWLADTWNMPYYPLHFRQEAQALLEKLTGYDLSSTILMNENNHQDVLTDEKLGLIDLYFTPGDIMVRIEDYPNGWPFEGAPGTDLVWYYNEATIQVKAYWYGDTYLSPSIRSNWDTILYHEFERYDYSSTVSRCVRTVD